MFIRGQFKEYLGKKGVGLSDIFGQIVFPKLVQLETAKLPAKKQLLPCPGIGSRVPCGSQDRIHFAHNPWKSRVDLTLDSLAKYAVGDAPITADTVYEIPDHKIWAQ